MNDKHNRTPIITPLLLALKSRRVLVALAALVLGLLLAHFPALHSVQQELFVLLITLALAVIGGYSLEDAAYAARATPPASAAVDEAALRGLLRHLLVELLAEALEDAHTEEEGTE